MTVQTQIIEFDIPFLVFADCIPVKGKERSIICDLGRQDYILIPNALFEIISLYEGKSINSVKEAYNHEFDSIIEEYFDHLLKKEIIFFTTNPELFPKIDINKWDEPHEILQCIVDFDSMENVPLSKLAHEINSVRCRFLQLRFFRHLPNSFVNRVVGYFNDSCVECIEIILEFHDDINIDDYRALCQANLRIGTIIVTNSPQDETVGVIGVNSFANIVFLRKKIIGHINCGVISSQYFSVNIKAFTEAQNHNSCLNRKISIDTKGDIKNCPSMDLSYGNIANTTLAAALKTNGFKKYWNVTKDSIDVCKDCEFRYICTDCRAYIEVPNNELSKPLKCGYDPNTNEWQEWSTNPIKRIAIEHYKLEEIALPLV